MNVGIWWLSQRHFDRRDAQRPDVGLWIVATLANHFIITANTLTHLQEPSNRATVMSGEKWRTNRSRECVSLLPRCIQLRGQTKVRQLHSTLFCKQNICALDIPVDFTQLMDIRKSLTVSPSPSPTWILVNDAERRWNEINVTFQISFR